MYMIFADNASQYVYLKPLTGLTDELSYAKRQVPLQQMISVLCHPYKVIFNLKLGMTPLAIVHAEELYSNR